MNRLALSTLSLTGLLLFSTASSLAQTSQTSYPRNERQSFINSCAYDRGSQVREICACTFDKIKANYSYTEYQTIRRQIRNGQNLPTPVVTMIEDCRREVRSR